MKFSFYLLVFLSLYEGIFRKWLIPTFSTPIVVLKFSACILFGAMSFFYLNKMNKKDFEYKHLLVIFVFYILVTFISSLILGQFINWFVGALNYLGYLMLIVGATYVLNSTQKINVFINFLLITLLLCVLIGTIQFQLPSTHWINQYASGERIAMSGSSVRIVSIFNYITSFGLFLSLSVPILFVKCLYTKSALQNLIMLFVLAISLFCVFATGSRIVVIQVMVTLLTVFFLYASSRGLGKKKLFTIVAVSAATMFLIINPNFIPSIGTFLDRVESINQSYDTTFIGNIQSRLEWAFSPIINAFNSDVIYNLVGAGPGSLNSYFLDVEVNTGSYIVHRDQPLSTTIYEIGLLGTALYTALLFMSFISQFAKSLRIKNQYYKLLNVAMLLSLLQYLTYMSSMSTNWFASFHFWIVIGLSISVNKVARKRINEKSYI